jgi:hypothetical protein
MSRSGFLRCLLHRSYHVLDRREVRAFPGDWLTVHQDGEFALVTIDELHLDCRFPRQRIRHTGGMLARPSSDGALPNGHLLHGSLSLFGRYKIAARDTLAEGVP